MTSLGNFYTKDTPRIHEKHQVENSVITLLCETLLILCERPDLRCERPKINQKKAGITPAKVKNCPVMDKVARSLDVP